MTKEFAALKVVPGEEPPGVRLPLVVLAKDTLSLPLKTFPGLFCSQRAGQGICCKHRGSPSQSPGET